MPSVPSSVSPDGEFLYGIHRPSFRVANHREKDLIKPLGAGPNNETVLNQVNFPPGDLEEAAATWIYEIPNPFPFRGTTFIKKDWADRRAEDPSAIRLPKPEPTSLTSYLQDIINDDQPAALDRAFTRLPRALQLALATTSTDPTDLVRLARLSCRFTTNNTSEEPDGMRFVAGRGRTQPEIIDHALFEAVANNPHLPDIYKTIMVIRPGAQGASEIVGEFTAPGQPTHVFEYLRRNSYIAWGHYAANMADDAIRYHTGALLQSDMTGLRHLYYQRTYLRMAEELSLTLPPNRTTLDPAALETLRDQIQDTLNQCLLNNDPPNFTATLWGWNYGFDYAPTHYRLHASHQQIHQQYALLPRIIPDQTGSARPAYCCGDLVAEFTERYRREHDRDFFTCYLQAIRRNRRMDDRDDRPTSLIVHEDERVMLFVPKAQTSQWELQLICLKNVGNIIEADTRTREALDRAILKAQQIYATLGARLVTSIEYPKRFDSADSNHRLLYAFLPRLPESPGAFSEAQLRFINGHYPEDFAAACRLAAGDQP
ncbi:MAG: hypothetical protein KJ950_13985 [Proteobacteria bacterium]|nr:hypothetical protein [Pseudomonadota bacterium]MBU1686120.1 hypothetical protein [Pseudomonadota bacterium]